MANKSNNNITSDFLQGVIDDKNRLNETLENVTKSSLSAIMEERVETGLRKILSEAEDEFVEDEIDDVQTSDGDEVDVVSDETEEDGEDTGIWDDLEQYKDEDGEYDLTGMDTDSLMQVMSVMKPTDGVRVMKSDDSTITLTDDTTEKEYEITIDGDEVDVQVVGDEVDGESDFDGEELDDVEGESDDEIEFEFDAEEDDDFSEENDGEEEYEIEFDDEEDVEECSGKNCKPVNEGNVDLGYTDNFQNKTAMTTPSNDEPADSKSTYSMDKGVPTGTSKAWAGKGNSDTYSEKVNEGEGEEEIDEAASTVAKNGPVGRGVTRSFTADTNDTRNNRNGHKNGKQVTGTADNSYSGGQTSESIRRKVNALVRENKKLKELIPEMQQQLMECIVINKSMGNVMRLVTENTTTMSEKKEILGRFAKVKTLDESDQLYGVIKEELSRQGKTIMNNGIMNPQLAESRNHSVKEPMYQSEDLSKTINLMQRLEKMK